MKVAIVGYATDGRASADYFAARGDAVTICDQNETVVIPDEFAFQLGSTYLQGLDQFDLIVRSSGIHPSTILAANPDVGSKITTSVNEFLAACPTQNTIGITGTKGKGTTSTLVTKMLEAAGKKVHLGGNIGNSPLEFLPDVQPNDWVVLELSSYQLADMTHSPHIAACLMVVPEHLNWHADMADYAAAKSHLFEQQNSDDIAIYFAENEMSRRIAQVGAGQKLPYYTSPGAWVNGNVITIDGVEVCTTDELKLLGTHNWQNVCAAVTVVWQTGVKDIDAIRQVATSFAGLPHRLERVRTVDDVTYYNDSFASTPDAAIAALQAIEGKKVVINGGYDRGLPLTHLAAAYREYADHIRKVLLIGASAVRVADECKKAGYKNYEILTEQTIEPIVKRAQKLAHHGESVVFSPGFASYDMFKNFEDRGLQYKATVEAL